MEQQDAINISNIGLREPLVRKPRGIKIDKDSQINSLTAFSTIINIVLATGPFT
jgi:hypothetical protein